MAWLQAAAEHETDASPEECPRHLDLIGEDPARGNVDDPPGRQHARILHFPSVPDFMSQGVRINYLLTGPPTGRPTLLVHGFASSYALNWVGSRWQETLVADGRLVVGLDLRGHGQSDKPHEPSAYGQHLATDVINLLDHVEIAEADYVGYSMGARIGLQTVLHHPERIGRAVLGGLGGLGAWSKAQAVAGRLRGDESITDPVAQFFHAFATLRNQSNDLEALAACITGPPMTVTDQELARIRNPVLLVVGDKDPLARGARALADTIPSSEYLELPGRDHMTAVVARAFKEHAVEFLNRREQLPR